MRRMLPLSGVAFAVLFLIGWFASGGDAPDYTAPDQAWATWAEDNQWRSRIGAFAMLLGRVLPMQVESRRDTRVEVTYRSVEEVRAGLEARGITIEAVKRVLMYEPPKKIDAADLPLPRRTSAS